MIRWKNFRVKSKTGFKFVPWEKTPSNFKLKEGDIIMYDGQKAKVTRVGFGASGFDIKFKSGRTIIAEDYGNKWNDVRFKVKK